MDSDETDLFGPRSILFWAITVGLFGWTAWCLGDGFWLMYSVTSDQTGAAAYSRISAVLGDTPASRQLFASQWSNLQSRGLWLDTFFSTFWMIRLQAWGIPTIAIGVLALLIKPTR